MKKYNYSNEFETYEIHKTEQGWVISQDGIWAENRFKTLKDAKTCIDNQEVRWG